MTRFTYSTITCSTTNGLCPVVRLCLKFLGIPQPCRNHQLCLRGPCLSCVTQIFLPCRAWTLLVFLSGPCCSCPAPTMACSCLVLKSGTAGHASAAPRVCLSSCSIPFSLLLCFVSWISRESWVSLLTDHCYLLLRHCSICVSYIQTSILSL